MSGPFSSIEEVDAYIHDEYIECLECGRRFKMLCTHLKVHGMDEDAYRGKYNIPKRFNLECRNTTNRKSESNTQDVSFLTERIKKARTSKRVFAPQHKMFADAFISAGVKSAMARRLQFSNEQIMDAYKIYTEDSTRQAREYLGVSQVTLYEILRRNGLQLKWNPQ
jgi:hypothetical protein